MAKKTAPVDEPILVFSSIEVGGKRHCIKDVTMRYVDLEERWSDQVTLE